MAISKKIIKYLEAMKYKSEIIEHKTTYTAFDTARTTQKLEKKVKPEEIAKTLAIRADKYYALALVSANKRLDEKKLLKLINLGRKKNKETPLRSLELAKEAWMKKNLLGKVGATPAFNDIQGLDIYIDTVLAKQKFIRIGSGEYEYSIKVPVKQYLKYEKPVIGSFGSKK
jgi:prolyl-tRNA editing enzyme YbaK/EbsC (Cys-tRNA(Pro) deacylase)